MVYYKGMQAVNTLDHRFVATKESGTGMTELNVTGSGNVAVGYAGTALQRISVLVSMATVFAMGLSIRRRKCSFAHARL
ncbi:hypothetical protein [Furfurilactobacillus rossiae]|uniref:hypothetical protein n=1 Tax=Furfurilactobacillus rossiae TaxID=231049 RepID=UPI0015C06CB9|nr:hypothetical protein [Furfurilactobacillus rossiae]